MPINTRTRKVWGVILAVAAFAAAALPSGAAAIFTSISDGSAVNQNSYTSAQDVYLNGGPQNKNAAGLPNGFYYFQVTDPSGGTLLSLDAITKRALAVAGGVISGVGASGGNHLEGTFNPNNLSTPVQLFPFSATPNPGGEYKVWLTKVGDYKPGEGKFGFKNNKSWTDNFKIRPVQIASPVPEPATMVLSGIGLAAVIRRRSGRRSF